MDPTSPVLVLAILVPSSVALLTFVIGTIRWAGRRARKDWLDSQPPPHGHPHAAAWQPPRRRAWVFGEKFNYQLVVWPTPITRARAQRIRWFGRR